MALLGPLLDYLSMIDAWLLLVWGLSIIVSLVQCHWHKTVFWVFTFRLFFILVKDLLFIFFFLYQINSVGLLLSWFFICLLFVHLLVEDCNRRHFRSYLFSIQVFTWWFSLLFFCVGSLFFVRKTDFYDFIVTCKFFVELIQHAFDHFFVVIWLFLTNFRARCCCRFGFFRVKKNLWLFWSGHDLSITENIVGRLFSLGNYKGLSGLLNLFSQNLFRSRGHILTRPWLFTHGNGPVRYELFFIVIGNSWLNEMLIA